MTILASGSTLDSGPARDLIIKFADKAENTIILSSPQHCVHRNQPKRKEIYPLLYDTQVDQYDD